MGNPSKATRYGRFIASLSDDEVIELLTDLEKEIDGWHRFKENVNRALNTRMAPTGLDMERRAL